MIKVKNLEFTYKGTGKRAVQDITFTVEQGEIFGFLGPSGAGKTTTQKLITGLLRGYRGNIEIMGEERKEWGNEFFERIGVAFEFPNLYTKLTAVENLELFGSYYKNRKKDINMLLDSVGLLEDKDHKIENFSKGMKVRLNFVRAILHDPEIIFLDEPTSGLDPVNAKIVKDMILRLSKERKTIFLTTHNMTVAEQLCDRVAFMVDGKLSLIDNPKKLKMKYGSKTVVVEYIENGIMSQTEFQLAGIGENKEFLSLIKNNEVHTMHSSEATLENIFIKVTGRTLL